MTVIENNRRWMNRIIQTIDEGISEDLWGQWYLGMIECGKAIVSLERRKTKESKECIRFVRETIIPFLNKKKWMPDSYADMLEGFKIDKTKGGLE